MRTDHASQGSGVLAADPETLIKRFYGLGSIGVAELADEYTESQRADLAAYCYSRSHLYDLALAIAATCEIEALTGTLGLPGEHLYAQSRCKALAVVPRHYKRGSVTLATSVGRIFPPLDSSEERHEPEHASAHA